MGFVLYREVRDGAPADWTPAERLVALIIADDANDTTRRSWLPLAGRWRRGEWDDGLTERTGLSAAGVSKALQRLGGRGYEFRVPITTGKDGRPVFAVKGRSLDFRVPPIYPRPLPQRPDESLPYDGQRADEHPAYDDEREDHGPAYDGQRADRGPVKGGPSSAPSPQHLSSQDKNQKMVDPEDRPGPEAMVSRRARASGTSARIISSQDKIEGTRFAIAAVYGESWNKSISDEEALRLFELKAPRNGRVTSPTAYMTKIFGDTPAFDTLLSQLDNETDAGSDDYGQAHDARPPWACPKCGGVNAERDTFLDLCAYCVREGIINGEISDTRHVIPNTKICPRCEASWIGPLTKSGICGGCERQLRPPVPVEGWNVSILKAVKTALFICAGKNVDDAWAAKVADQILSSASKKVTAPARYVTTTISNDPNPARFLPTPTP